MKQIYLLLMATLLIGGNTFAQIYGQTFGQTGLVDAEFANNGIIIESYSATANMNGHTSVLQPDGKMIMAGGNGNNEVTLVRYNTEGYTDNGFGTNGKVVITAPAGNTLGGANASLTVQTDGKIIYASNANGKIALARLKANGTLDSTFGTAGLSYTQLGPLWYSNVGKVIVKPDGKILIGGTGTYNITSPYFEVVQFLSNGTLDPSFGTGGIFHYSAGPSGSCYSIALMPNDHVIVGGIRFPIGVMAAVNLKPNGVIDSTWGTNGVATCQAYLNDKALYCRVALQNDNKVLLVGYGNWQGNRKAIGLGRFKTNGKPDSTFAYLGTLTSTFENFGDFAQNVNEQFDGTLVLSGYSNNKFAMMRLKSNGTTDTTYGRLGKVLTAIPGNGGVVNSSFLQPDGKLVLTGTTKFNNVYSFVAARFVVTPNPHYNTLKGFTFLDINKNGIHDSGEPYLANTPMKTIRANHDSLVTYSSNGHFLIDVMDTGTYVSNSGASFLYYTSPAPANHITTNTTYFNTDSVNFFVEPIPGLVDASVNILCQSGVARVGTTQRYDVICANKTTNLIDSAKVKYIMDHKVTFVSANPAPASIHGDTLVWELISMLPMQSQTIELSLAIPTWLTLHDFLHFSSTITPNKIDIHPSDNVSSIDQIIGNSYDPNDKSEDHGGKITTAQVSNGEYLTYTIRFQNTGNDSAINIYIRDTLSSKLDWNSLEMITASNNYQLIMNDGKCLWAFNNIYLPDSNHSEPKSHGYLMYRIKPKANVQVADVIKNTAAIYFDYNLPIYTNTEMTTVVADAQPLKLLSFTAKKEGKTNLLNWISANEVNVDRFEVERSRNSREFSKIGTVKAGANNYSFTDKNPLKATNYYRLKMIDKDGQFTYSPVRMLNNSGSFFVSIYPNPAKDNLQVQIDSDKKTTLQMKVLSLDGKVILSNTTTSNEGSILRSINISTLQRGNYYLKATTADKDEQVVKFEKM